MRYHSPRLRTRNGAGSVSDLDFMSRPSMGALTLPAPFQQCYTNENESSPAHSLKSMTLRTRARFEFGLASQRSQDSFCQKGISEKNGNQRRESLDAARTSACATVQSSDRCWGNAGRWLQPAHRIIPFRTAYKINSARLFTFNFRIRLPRCVSTV